MSELGKGINITVLNNATNYLDEHAQLTFTSISVYEQLYGFGLKSATAQIQRFLNLIAPHEEIVPDKSDYRLAASMRAALQRAGTPIGSIDPIIAACAATRNTPLVTGNTRHHGYIRDTGFSLQLVNWRDSDTN